jgi:hypothetical protein
VSGEQGGDLEEEDQPKQVGELINDSQIQSLYHEAPRNGINASP